MTNEWYTLCQLTDIFNFDMVITKIAVRYLWNYTKKRDSEIYLKNNNFEHSLALDDVNLQPWKTDVQRQYS